jgi:outer membrane protein assembly factor BamB
MSNSRLFDLFSMATFKNILVVLFSLLICGVRVNALGATDTITWGGDNSRSGYQEYVFLALRVLAGTKVCFSNHNMDPEVVGSANFGQLFQTLLPGNFNGMGPEQIFSQPLVYTGSDGVQYVYIATTQNNIYKLDAKTGAIVARRNLHVPFLQVDLEGKHGPTNWFN